MAFTAAAAAAASESLTSTGYCFTRPSLARDTCCQAACSASHSGGGDLSICISRRRRSSSSLGKDCVRQISAVAVNITSRPDEPHPQHTELLKHLESHSSSCSPQSHRSHSGEDSSCHASCHYQRVIGVPQPARHVQLDMKASQLIDNCWTVLCRAARISPGAAPRHMLQKWPFSCAAAAAAAAEATAAARH